MNTPDFSWENQIAIHMDRLNREDRRRMSLFLQVLHRKEKEIRLLQEEIEHIQGTIWEKTQSNEKLRELIQRRWNVVIK